ncbi:hypothetical protein KSP40_PGU016510 [Platanthera guangdongensis]|uniref:Uncharacterized protein n=1 Tax=Platanthera guangdongensis TaxID=2320717 RepID=A0ABR2MDQ7_9ASPA
MPSLRTSTVTSTLPSTSPSPTSGPLPTFTTTPPPPQPAKSPSSTYSPRRRLPRRRGLPIPGAFYATGHGVSPDSFATSSPSPGASSLSPSAASSSSPVGPAPSPATAALPSPPSSPSSCGRRDSPSSATPPLRLPALPHHHHFFCEVMEEYMKEMKKVGERVMRLMLLSLVSDQEEVDGIPAVAELARAARRCNSTPIRRVLSRSGPSAWPPTLTPASSPCSTRAPAPAGSRYCGRTVAQICADGWRCRRGPTHWSSTSATFSTCCPTAGSRTYDTEPW